LDKQLEQIRRNCFGLILCNVVPVAVYMAIAWGLSANLFPLQSLLSAVGMDVSDAAINLTRLGLIAYFLYGAFSGLITGVFFAILFKMRATPLREIKKLKHSDQWLARTLLTPFFGLTTGTITKKDSIKDSRGTVSDGQERVIVAIASQSKFLEMIPVLMKNQSLSTIALEPVRAVFDDSGRVLAIVNDKQTCLLLLTFPLSISTMLLNIDRTFSRPAPKSS
jgi:hypothetical protein